MRNITEKKNRVLQSLMLDAEDDQNLSVFNEVAVTTIWFDDLNNEYEETFNEEEENGETLAEDAIYEIVLTINHMI